MDSNIMHEQLMINENNPVIARFYDYDHFTYPWHFHSAYEIIYVRESHGERFVADSIGTYNSGEIIFLGSNLPHYMRSHEIYYKNDPELRVKGVIIQFAHDFMAHSINNYADFIPIRQLLKNSKRGLFFPHPENGEIIQLIEELPKYTGFKRIINLLFLLEKMATFKHTQLLGSPNYRENTPDMLDDRIEKIISYLNYHYLEHITLDEIANKFSMNPSAFCRYFKQKTSKTYVDYIQDLRVGHACNLLTGTSFDIAQISIECGFNTICHFNKIFKRKKYLTPSEFRKKII